MTKKNNNVPISAHKKRNIDTLKPSLVRHKTEAIKKFRNKKNIDQKESNPLIINSSQITSAMKKAFENTGVRAAMLKPVVAEIGYSNMMTTPNGKQVRPLCSLGGLSLFKPVTPFSKLSEQARADLTNASQNTIVNHLPWLNAQRAEPIEFTATLDIIQEWAKKTRRESLGQFMGASASEVFIAHGIEVDSSHRRSHHWAHLIAHFLCHSQHITSNEKQLINLVPSTAAANYNTLKMVERFIKQTLENKRTDRMHISVDPIFKGEALIPDSLVYTLTWNEKKTNGEMIKHQHVYYINPPSYERVTRVMKESILMLRQIYSESLSDTFNSNDTSLEADSTDFSL
jgi:hypothetical protein